MPIIGHGKAFAFPYGFLPWFTASLLYPLLGDWVVTLWLVLGFVGLVAAMFWAFPEIRRGWWAATALVNPTLVIAPIVVATVIMGVVPNLFLRSIEPSVERLINQVHQSAPARAN